MFIQILIAHKRIFTAGGKNEFMMILQCITCLSILWLYDDKKLTDYQVKYELLFLF